ncbi:hypothetical protein B0T18DRAFT_83434 [Schizothecium vesticola]|uniref:RING-type domain-containing protein n=1 Tax=Schizothecium vesticola TaxID=314040 RepID=A0AA40KB12_9PEZI|nr:hypothetical protein B0T18DRAFT_83434 [Schizothecium vesticola]
MNILRRHSKRASLSVDNKDSMLSEKKKKQGTVRTVEVDPEEHPDCPICQDPVGIISESGTLEHWRYLPCNHKFGRECIRTYLAGWFESSDKPLCPICRAPAYHTCGHVVLPQPPGVQRRPTTTTCDFCSIYNSARWLIPSRQRRHKPQVVWRRALLTLVPRNTMAHWRAREAWIRAQEQYEGHKGYVPWQTWWETRDRQPPVPKR